MIWSVYAYVLIILTCRHLMAENHLRVVTIHHMREDRIISSFASEIVVLRILFLLYIVGAAIATVRIPKEFYIFLAHR